MTTFVLAQRKKPLRPCSEKRLEGGWNGVSTEASDSAIPYPAGGSVAGRFRGEVPAAETGPRPQDHRGGPGAGVGNGGQHDGSSLAVSGREVLTQRRGDHRRFLRSRVRDHLEPVTALSQELVRFDRSKLKNPESWGAEYQQGTLLGYGVREYLLTKWGR